MRPRYLALPAAILLASLLTACGGGGGTTSTSTSSTTSSTGTTTSTSTTPPTAQLAATAKLNGTTDLTWSSTNATSCTISGSYNGNVATSGTLNVTAPVNDKQSYSLTCTGGGGPATVAATPTPITSVASTCADSNFGYTNYYWLNEWLLSNPTFVNGIPANQNCLSGSVAADGTVTINDVWQPYPTPAGTVRTYVAATYGYPSYLQGIPNLHTTDAAFPQAVANITPTLGVTYSDSINASPGSAYDLLIDFHISDKQYGGTLDTFPLDMSVNPVWSMGVLDNLIGSITVNGVTYGIQYAPANSIVPNSAPHLGFTNFGAPATSGTIPLKPFIDWAINHGYINASGTYIQDIQVGHELFTGSGTSTTTVKFNP